MPTSSVLAKTLADLRKRIAQAGTRVLNEQQTNENDVAHVVVKVLLKNGPEKSDGEAALDGE